jgi:hypothetical protein
VLRVGQLDAEMLDQEVLQILKAPLEKALGLISVCYTSYEPAERSDNIRPDGTHSLSQN